MQCNDEVKFGDWPGAAAVAHVQAAKISRLLLSAGVLLRQVVFFFSAVGFCRHTLTGTHFGFLLILCIMLNARIIPHFSYAHLFILPVCQRCISFTDFQVMRHIDKHSCRDFALTTTSCCYITAQTMAYTTHIITLCMLPLHRDHPPSLHPALIPPTGRAENLALSQPATICMQ